MPLVRRGRAHSAYRVPLEVWTSVALLLADKPRKVFMLLCAIKGLKLDDEWWEALYKRTKPYQRNGKMLLDFVKVYELRRSCQFKVVFRLVYGMFCNHCGCRYHHKIFDPYNMRLCNLCLRENHVSNVVLWKDYGLGLEEIGLHYKELVRYMALTHYTKEKELTKFTRDPRDYAARKTSKMIFFWKPDLCRFIDLDARAVEHRRKLDAVSVLKNVFKRTYATSVGKRYFVETLHENELKRMIHPTTGSPFTVGTNHCMGDLLKVGRYAQRDPPDFNIFLAFQRQPKMSILGDREYTVRTMAHRLNLSGSEAAAKLGELATLKGGVAAAIGMVFQM